METIRSPAARDTKTPLDHRTHFLGEILQTTAIVSPMTIPAHLVGRWFRTKPDRVRQKRRFCRRAIGAGRVESGRADFDVPGC